MPKLTMTRRFYVGSESIVDSDYLMIKSEAIDKGIIRMQKDPNIHKLYVVEVVAVLERESPPIVTIEVRRD